MTTMQKPRAVGDAGLPDLSSAGGGCDTSVVAPTAAPLQAASATAVAMLHRDPVLPLVAVRDQTVCLKIRAIGEASRLAVTPYGVGFEPYRPGPQDRITPTRHRARRAA